MGKRKKSRCRLDTHEVDQLYSRVREDLDILAKYKKCLSWLIPVCNCFSILKVFKTVTLGEPGESVCLPVCLFVYHPRGLSSHGECSLFLNERKASCNDPGSNSALATYLLSGMEQYF